MGIRATARFTIERVSEEPYGERSGVRLIRGQLTKKLTGDVEGTSSAEILMACGHREDSLAYVGLELVEGRLHGRRGTFVLHYCATVSAGVIRGSSGIVPDSGTDELRRLRGRAELASPLVNGGQLLLLDYELG